MKYLITLLIITSITPLLHALEISTCSVLNADGYYLLSSDITSSSTCITFKDVEFAVLNCNNKTISSYNSIGINILNASNITLMSCLINDTYNALNITNSTNIYLENIALKNSSYGVYIYNSHNVLINDTTIVQSNRSIYLIKSNNITIKNTRIEETNESLHIYKSQTYIEDTVTSQRDQAFMGAKINNSYTNIKNLTLHNYKYGIYIYNSSLNISSSNISSNFYGVVLENAYNTSIYNNYISNDINLVHISSNNVFLNTTYSCDKKSITLSPCIGGNFWGNKTRTDYSDTCTDNDGNGICDSPYTIAGLTDHHPLSKYVFVELDSDLSYRVNESSTITLKGNAVIMPYKEIYVDNISLVIDNTYIYNITTSSGKFYYVLTHPINTYWKNLSLIAYHNKGISNNTYFLKPNIFSLKILPGGVNVYYSSSENITIFYNTPLRIILMPLIRYIGGITISNEGMDIKGNTNAGILGISNKDENTIIENIELFYAKDYCYFIFSGKAPSLCNTYMIIKSPLEISSTISYLGEGDYTISLKRLGNKILVSVQ